ncbi:nucleotidyl transferase AbiEii/AbiGii toxin family protein [Nannocystis radixulma]|uniref:Nucleotidyl transferase AbiEii/AbiGii toxin family protein n=1 Tax=Nannocystis radixulma TaxID=2995305 RepID=A0ABT5B2Z9_9BACT|nr:nucleotidyl transferase AbiEii/AbiGii toxin family protein [Nannocystis radixulma]MDC0668484.1 nucleotidyl transferase AbiEii/AbiGii toxin family protein [Nannocystis radixulma]
MFARFREAVTLKGGVALELRIERARTTKDVDLRWMGESTDLLLRLRGAVAVDLGDFLQFEIDDDPEQPEIDNDGAIYGGRRFRVTCKLAGKPFGNPFGVDVGFGEPILGEPDLVVPEDALAFIGVRPPELRLYPLETHIAEKLHAYTLPRKHMNSRVKDLRDIALLASVRGLDGSRVRSALELTFSFRCTHAVPGVFPEPPDAWDRPYAALAREHELPWSTLAEVTAAVRAFFEPLLRGDGAAAGWDPAAWRWAG